VDRAAQAKATSISHVPARINARTRHEAALSAEASKPSYKFAKVSTTTARLKVSSRRCS
jgi:hypothetical protein